jgi:alpha-1,3-rhamnosyltransferase
MREQPLVSVVIAAYNQEGLVERAVRSVLDQTYPRVELVVVDDGSRDRTWEVVSRLQRESARPFRAFTKPNEGVSRTLNFGIGHTSGPLIALLAADDHYLPDKLERQVRLFAEAGPRTGLVHSSAYMDHGGGAALVDTHGTFVPASGACFDALITMEARVTAPTATFRREAYLEAGGFDETLVAEDVDFYVALAAHGWEFRYDPTPTVVKTVTGKNLGGRIERWYDVHFQTLAKYADRLSAAEYARVENHIWEHMGRICAGAGRLGLSWKAYSTLARRTGSVAPYLDFAGRAARHVTLSAVPGPVRHGLRAVRRGIAARR